VSIGFDLECAYKKQDCFQDEHVNQGFPDALHTALL